jgi:hypothetical protein
MRDVPFILLISFPIAFQLALTVFCVWSTVVVILTFPHHALSFTCDSAICLLLHIGLEGTDEARVSRRPV